MIELAEVETEYRAASSKRFSPTQSVAASVEPLSDPEPETDDTSQDGALGPDDAPGACVERHVPETETQVRHDVAEGKRRCGSAPPATTDLAGRPLSAPSVELFVRGTATYNEMEIAQLKGIVDSRIEAVQDASNNAAHWAQVQEEDDERELMRSTPLALGGFLFRDGLEGE